MPVINRRASGIARGSRSVLNVVVREMVAVTFCGAAAGALFNTVFSAQPWSAGCLLGGVLSALAVWLMS